MASTKSASVVQRMCTPAVEFELSSLDAGLQEDHAHGGPSGVNPSQVFISVLTPATDGSDIQWDWDRADDSETNSTVRLRFNTNAGGNLAGAKVLVRCEFAAMASGGIDPPS